jgi:predicted AlkP superfamily pyrophosphatase or phosphodiesterase
MRNEILGRAARVIAAGLCALGLAAATPASAAPAKHKLLVVSVDGLDWRYLRDRDALGLAIPNMRRLLREGDVAQGVVGVFPTITWPSHTSLITGARPDQHGIRGNGRIGSPDYWTPASLKAPTLWQCAGDSGLTTAAITWPVTTDAQITWDLPEYFLRRNGGEMDLQAVASRATPGLIAAISKAYPSFAQQWVDDRTRTLATLYLLKEKQPDLVLLHLVDLDSEAHDQGPFAQNADAVLERTDELLGQLLAGLPQGYDVVLTSDHGFERIDHISNLKVLAAEAGVKGDLRPMGGVVVTSDPAVAAFLRSPRAAAEGLVGREIPHDELVRYAPALTDAVAAFEPAEHAMFGAAETGPLLTAPREKGEHGFWPLRHDYRSVFLAWGPGVKPSQAPELQMIDIEGRLAAMLGIGCPR